MEQVLLQNHRYGTVFCALKFLRIRIRPSTAAFFAQPRRLRYQFEFLYIKLPLWPLGYVSNKSPKGLPTIAQGNALGTDALYLSSSEGAE